MSYISLKMEEEIKGMADDIPPPVKPCCDTPKEPYDPATDPYDKDAKWYDDDTGLDMNWPEGPPLTIPGDPHDSFWENPENARKFSLGDPRVPQVGPGTQG